MSKLTIGKIASLTNLGVFKACTAAQALPLRRYNLIYGFNGSGKTTLSRVFGSLEAGTLSSGLPEGGTFDIELNDGTIIKSTGNVGTLKGRLLVFNLDFVEENFKWNEGTVNPVFHLGREQVELVKKLEAVSSQRNAVLQRVKNAHTTHSDKHRTFVTYKRDAARLVAEQLGLGRKYDASDLARDYSACTYDKADTLPDEETQQLRQVLMREAPLAKLDLLSVVTLNSPVLIGEVRMILDKTLGDMTVADLRAHDSMLSWIHAGVTYHEEHELASCLFCGQDLIKDRLQALREVINDKFDKFTRAIAAAKTKAEGLQNSCAAIDTAIPSINDVSQSLRARFIPIVNNLKMSLSAVSKTAQVILELLAQKLASPNSHIDPGILVRISDAAAKDELLKRQITDFNNVVTLHNVEYDNFDNVKADAKKKLKEHYLSTGQAGYSVCETQEKEARAESERLDAEYARLEKEEEGLKREIRQHGPAAELINRMICNYLGRDELAVTVLEDGYQLRRSGKPVKGSLSEGEKTAITFCYFLAMLEAEGRKLKDLIVVVDDPISSLDTKALNYCFNILKSALGNVCQLFLLTHNLHFMNEAKKWLKGKAYPRNGAEPTAALLFLDAVQKQGEEGLFSAIKEMPKYIREYESEYQYLFHLVWQFAQTPDGLTGYFYVMPNAMRKVLEIFLAFKLPGNEGLSNKLEIISRDLDRFDGGRIRALDRLVQLESHADNLDDLLSFSSMTVEETRDAAAVLLNMIKELDEKHYERLVGNMRQLADNSNAALFSL